MEQWGVRNAGTFQAVLWQAASLTTPAWSCLKSDFCLLFILSIRCTRVLHPFAKLNGLLWTSRSVHVRMASDRGVILISAWHSSVMINFCKSFETNVAANGARSVQNRFGRTAVLLNFPPLLHRQSFRSVRPIRCSILSNASNSVGREYGDSGYGLHTMENQEYHWISRRGCHRDSLLERLSNRLSRK